MAESVEDSVTYLLDAFKGVILDEDVEVRKMLLYDFELVSAFLKREAGLLDNFRTYKLDLPQWPDADKKEIDHHIRLVATADRSTFANFLSRLKDSSETDTATLVEDSPPIEDTGSSNFKDLSGTLSVLSSPSRPSHTSEEGAGVAPETIQEEGSGVAPEASHELLDQPVANDNDELYRIPQEDYTAAMSSQSSRSENAMSGLSAETDSIQEARLIAQIRRTSFS